MLPPTRCTILWRLQLLPAVFLSSMFCSTWQHSPLQEVICLAPWTKPSSMLVFGSCFVVIQGFSMPYLHHCPCHHVGCCAAMVQCYIGAACARNVYHCSEVLRIVNTVSALHDMLCQQSKTLDTSLACSCTHCVNIRCSPSLSSLYFVLAVYNM